MRVGYWIGLLLACAITTTAQVPYAFNYQGVLRGGSGEMLPAGAKIIEFKIYTGPTGGSAIWGRSYSVLLDTNGLFNLTLTDDAGSQLVAAGDPLSKVVATSSTLYLGLKVSGAAEIAPRQQLLAVPFAMMAGDVKTTSGSLTVNGVLTVTNGVKVTGIIEGNGTIPIGGIILWHGSSGSIPLGWALCDGSKSTPDLRNRFVVGAGDTYPVSATGGVASVTLTTDQMPVHGHGYHDGYYVERSGKGSKYVSGGGVDTIGNDLTGSDGTDGDNTEIYWRPMNTFNNGSGTAHENRPPYYALCYIMRTN